jgi:hypothetical protein
MLLVVIPFKGSMLGGAVRAKVLRDWPRPGPALDIWQRRLFEWRFEWSSDKKRCPPRVGPTAAGNLRGRLMKFHVKALLAGAALMAMAGSAVAHHSFAMFDQEHPVDLVGVVKEWKYTAPHAFIILEVKEEDGTSQVWSLEGGAPSGLIRDGWTSKTLKPGDELQVKVDPLRSGAPGGAWNVNKVKFKNGDPIVVSH